MYFVQRSFGVGSLAFRSVDEKSSLQLDIHDLHGWAIISPLTEFSLKCLVHNDINLHTEKLFRVHLPSRQRRLFVESVRFCPGAIPR